MHVFYPPSDRDPYCCMRCAQEEERGILMASDTSAQPLSTHSH